MALPKEQRFFDKFLLAIAEDIELAKAYFKRFGVAYNEQTAEEIGWQIVDKLSEYGGYLLRRRLIESIPINPDDHVLDIGPEMGMECFLLAEAYSRVVVAEPDATTAALLKEIAKHYATEDGRKASDILDIHQMGIIPQHRDFIRTSSGKPSNVVDFDTTGAADIASVFGLHFADRVICHHIVSIMPARPRLWVLLTALASYCSDKGVITWFEELGELSPELDDYAEYKGYAKFKPYRVQTQKTQYVVWYPRSRIKTYIAELLPNYTITMKTVDKDPHLLVKAVRVRGG